jgi:hypothetical protein
MQAGRGIEQNEKPTEEKKKNRNDSSSPEIWFVAREETN